MKVIFKDNLLNIIKKQKYDLTIYTPYFVVCPIFENNVKYNSIDDLIKLWLLTESNVKDRLFTAEEVTDFLCFDNRLCPLWIEISFISIEDKSALFSLNISMRFRKSSQLKYIENGYPPFIFK